MVASLPLSFASGTNCVSRPTNYGRPWAKVGISQSLLKRISLIQKFEGSSCHQTALPFLATIRSTNSLGQLSSRSFLSIHYPELLPTNSCDSQQKWSHAIRPPLVSSLTSWTYSHSLGNFSVHEMACPKKKKKKPHCWAPQLWCFPALTWAVPGTSRHLLEVPCVINAKFSSYNLIFSTAPMTLRSSGSWLLFSHLWASSSFKSFPNQPKPHNPSLQLTACHPGSQFSVPLTLEFIQEAENHHRSAYKCH